MTDYQVKIVPCKINKKYMGHLKQIVVKDGNIIVGELCHKCGIRRKIDKEVDKSLTDSSEIQISLPV
jgi:hypothetical protein